MALDEYQFMVSNFTTPRVAVQAPATSPTLHLVVQYNNGVPGSRNVWYWAINGLVGNGGGTFKSADVDLTAANVIKPFADPIPARHRAFPAGMIDSRPTDAIWRNNRLTFVSTQTCTPIGDASSRTASASRS